MALLSHFLLLSLAVPLLAYARGQGASVLRIPESRETGNSQTMDLLAGYLNTNPTSIGGPSLAIVDSTTLSASGNDEGSAFVDPGHSGSGAITTYVVREGDTLGKIAEIFNISVNTIVWANDLKGKTLQVGQELVVLPISGVKHTVKSNDTLASIAKKYKGDLEDIISYNNIAAGQKLAVGDTIIIPDGVVSTSATVIATSNTQKVTSGYYLRPLRGGVKSQGIHGYNAVDIAAPAGTPLMASADGIVIIARTSGYNGGYGLYVVIKHNNGTQTVYGHMSQVSVSVGESVEQGQVIGAVGNTGRSTGSHVHFEIRGAKNPF